ncbi:PAAR motif protein [Vibrio phage 1.031.O._10N.261.46.F8]|nr:PAAR motif protein [Vibrio phage 1.031.O._10N.261.46.F8]
MAAASRIGDSTTGHGGPFPPTTISEGSGDVFINGKAAASIGSGIIPHTRTKKPFDTHGGAVSGGSSTVFINGKAASRIGDPVSCGDTVAAGSGDVFIGG